MFIPWVLWCSLIDGNIPQWAWHGQSDFTRLLRIIAAKLTLLNIKPTTKPSFILLILCVIHTGGLSLPLVTEIINGDGENTLIRLRCNYTWTSKYWNCFLRRLWTIKIYYCVIFKCKPYYKYPHAPPDVAHHHICSYLLQKQSRLVLIHWHLY